MLGLSFNPSLNSMIESCCIVKILDISFSLQSWCVDLNFPFSSISFLYKRNVLCLFINDAFSNDVRLSYITRFYNLYELEKKISLSLNILSTIYWSFGISSRFNVMLNPSRYLYGAFFPIK